MYDLTIGQISTLIAAAVFICGLVLRNAFPLIMVGFMGNANNAVTWGLVQRSLAGTDWPVILRTDATQKRTVDTKVRVLNLAYIATTVLLAVAAVVTPAGLYDAISSGGDITLAPFTLVEDKGALGRLPRPATPQAWRDCSIPYNVENGTYLYVDCPGNTPQNFTIRTNASGTFQHFDDSYNITMPRYSPEIFHSGLKRFASSVSSFFDIQSRVVKLVRSNDFFNFDHPTPVEGFQHVTSTVVEDEILAVSGLIIDARTVSPGIGFRNHSLPPSSPLGSQWQEDLLWLELDTACVDMNLSVEFGVDYLGADSAGVDTSYSLIDDGGFVNLDVSQRPMFALPDQDNLDLEARAWAQASRSLYSIMNMTFMNLTDANGQPDPSLSYRGRRILGTDSGSHLTQSSSIMSVVSPLWLLLDWQPSMLNYTEYNGMHTTQALCQGYNDTAPVSINSFGIQCGFLVGAAVEKSGKHQVIAEPGMTLKRKIYSCASATKTSLKTVSLSYNASDTHDLSRLDIRSISPKQYSDKQDMPLWGVETVDGFVNQGLNQLWGFVNDSYQNAANITSRRSPYLYPPVAPRTLSNGIGNDYQSVRYLPASDGLSALMGGTYWTSSSYSSLDASMTWNGFLDLALFSRWQLLSQDITSAASLMRLVWTDLAANYLTGSRGWTNPGIIPQAWTNDTTWVPSADVPVQQAQRRIMYHWPYAVPALIMCALLLLIIPCTLLAAIKGGLKNLHKYLSMLSAGRLLLGVAPESDSSALYRMPYTKWAKATGYGLTKVRAEGWTWTRLSNNDEGTEMKCEYLQIPKHSHSPTVQEVQEEEPPNTKAEANTAFLSDETRSHG